MTITLCSNSRCPIRHKCAKADDPNRFDAKLLSVKHYQFTRDQAGHVACGEFSRKYSYRDTHD